MNVFVLFPIDLYNDIQLLKKSKVFLVEEEHYFNRKNRTHGSMKLNILKPIYHRATMRCYYDYLISKGIECQYIEIRKDWTKIVNHHVDKNNAALNFYDPVDRYIEKKLNTNFEQYNIINTPRFFLTTEEMESYTGALRQTSFYKWIRETKNILMNENKNRAVPEGGKLTYDKENRKSPYPGIEDDVDDKVDYTDNHYVVEAFKYVKRTFNEDDHTIWGKESMGQLKKLEDAEIALKFPIDRKGSLARLRYFIRTNLIRFGDFQDVMLNDSENSFVFHSALSPMMNIGLLTPEEIVKEVINHYESLRTSDKKKKLNDVEGFVRQILGWREFCRYMYQHHSDKYMGKNYFNATKRLNKEWYNATTGILPIDTCIKKAFRFGYLHHIERLMLIANYMTLTGISPSHMYRWFMEFSLDSYDWVMEFNVYCMGSYADGGQFTSKPYISTSKYILSMSTYTKKDYVNSEIDNNESESNHSDTSTIHIWSKFWDDLFWQFLKIHKTKIKKIGRLAGLLRYVKKHK